MAGVVGVTKAAKNLNSKIGKVPKSCRANTMDLSKAQAIMGFSSTRWLDKSAGFNPKQELDKAHFEKMMEIMKKKKTWVPPKVEYLQFPNINIIPQVERKDIFFILTIFPKNFWNK